MQTNVIKYCGAKKYLVTDCTRFRTQKDERPVMFIINTCQLLGKLCRTFFP